MSVAPEITTVSKPKRRPPKAATMVLFRRYRFMGSGTRGPHGMVSRATGEVKRRLCNGGCAFRAGGYARRSAPGRGDRWWRASMASVRYHDCADAGGKGKSE